jgi:hypothetical protein
MPSELGQHGRRRGPLPNPQRGTPSGYRLTDRQRFEIGMAAQFLGTQTTQQTINIAVDELLARLRKVPGFEAALAAAEGHRRARAGIPRIPGGSDGQA